MCVASTEELFNRAKTTMMNMLHVRAISSSAPCYKISHAFLIYKTCVQFALVLNAYTCIQGNIYTLGYSPFSVFEYKMEKPDT